MKQDLRTQMLTMLQQTPQSLRAAANNMIADRLMKLDEWKNAQSFCLYVSRPWEVDTHAIITSLLNQKKTIVVPRVNSQNSLTLHLIRSFDELHPGYSSILEPQGDNPIDPTTVNVFVVPGLAFDPMGNRLGSGKGYYDRLLENISVPLIGLAFTNQIVPKLPTMPYDIRMTYVITEKGIYTGNPLF